MTRTITITSGKGGVGKTNLCLNLALYFSSQGKRTCLFDADLGLANINILLGIHPQYGINDVITAGVRIEDIIIKSHGIDILPGSSGIEEIANLEPERLKQLLLSLSRLENYDFLLFDTSAGIARNVISFCLSSPEVVIIITPEPTSVTDAYALLKVLKNNGYSGSIKVVVNMSNTAAAAKDVYKQFRAVVDKYLKLNVEPLGPVYQDSRLVSAVKQQRPLLDLYPDSVSAKCISKLGERLLVMQAGQFEGESMVSFWQRCVSFFTGPLNLPGQKPKEPPAVPESTAKIPLPAASRTSVKDNDGNLARAQETAPPLEKPQKPEQKKETEEVSVKSRQETMIRDAAPADAPSRHEQAPAPAGMTIPADFTDLLERFVEGTFAISEELRMIRETMEGRGGRQNPVSTSGSRDREQGETLAVPLDLKNFLRKKGKYSS